MSCLHEGRCHRFRKEFGVLLIELGVPGVFQLEEEIEIEMSNLLRYPQLVG
jgi:hypothetical protein